MSQFRVVSPSSPRQPEWSARSSEVKRDEHGDFVLSLGGADSLDDALKTLEREMHGAAKPHSILHSELPANWESRYAVFFVGQLGREPKPGDVIRVPAQPEAVFAAADRTSPELARRARELFESGQTLTVNRERRKRAHAERRALGLQGPGLTAPQPGIGLPSRARSVPTSSSSASRPSTPDRPDAAPSTESGPPKPRGPWTRSGDLRAQTAFEKRERLTSTLSRAGMPDRVVARILNEGITAEDAHNLANRLLQEPPSLEGFCPRMVTLAVLSHVVTMSGAESHPEAPRAGLDALYGVMERFEGMVVLRPDGYLAGLTSGRALRKLGTVVSRPYGYGVGPYPVGVPYISESNLFYEIAPDGSRGTRIGFVISNLDNMLAGRVLDGAENAVVATVDGVIAILKAPHLALRDAVHAVQSIPPAQEVVRWLANDAPEFVERFSAMPEGDQVEAISTVVSHLYTMGLLARPTVGFGDSVGKLGLRPTLNVIPNAAGGLSLRLGWSMAKAGAASASLGPATGALGALGILHSLPDPKGVDESRAVNREHYGVTSKGPARKPDLVKTNPQAEHWLTVDEFKKRYGGRVDLRAHEAAGGHTIEKHVGKTDGELRARLEREPARQRVSTFANEVEAAKAVNAALRHNALRIAEWEATSPTKVLELHAPFRGGRVVSRGAKPVGGSRVALFLRGDGAGRWTIVTAYPTP